MNIETLKMSVHELAKGMQVVKLDRPWLETPFKLQGFRINSSQELRVLEKYCKYVYIDIEGGVAPPKGKGERVTLTEKGEVVDNQGFIPSSSKSEKDRKNVSGVATQTALPAPAVQYALETEFEDELKVAMEVVEGAKNALKAFMQNFSEGLRSDLENVRKAATAVEESVLRNPDPGMLIRSLRSDKSFSYRHSVHSAVLGIALARELGFRKQNIHELTMGVLLSDIGKIRVPKELLRTPRRLEQHETEII